METPGQAERDKKTNIIALADDSACGRCAVAYGGVLAAIFHAGLTVITRFGFGYRPPEDNTPPDSIVQYVQQLSDHRIETFLTARYFFPEALYHYAEETNTALFVIGVGRNGGGFFNRRRAIRFIRPSRVPVMTVGEKMPAADVFRHVLLPLDIERQGKEKALWAGYFSRFYNAVVHVLVPHYKDKSLNEQVMGNVAFVKKLYANMEVTFRISEVQGVNDIDRHSLHFAPEVGASLTVIMMTKYMTLGDLLLGTREKHLIGNDEGLPVLCINQRDDLYILCT